MASYIGFFKAPPISTASPLTLITGTGITGYGTLTGTEGYALAGSTMIGVCLLTLNVTTFISGVAKKVIIEKSKDGGTTWTYAASKDINKGAVFSNESIEVTGLEWASGTGISWTFRATLVNSDGAVAVNSNSVSLTPISTSAIVFDGNTATITYMPAVTGLTNSNTSDVDGDTTTPVDLPSDGRMQLKWTDMKSSESSIVTTSAGGASAAGDNVTLTVTALRAIKSYAVYMFVATAASVPVKEYPVTSDANGTWYYVGDSSNPSFEFSPPRNKNVCIWVGCRIGTIAPSGISSNFTAS